MIFWLFYGQFSWLGLGQDSEPTFCGLEFQRSKVFSVCVCICFCSLLVLPGGQLEICFVVYLLSQFSKFLACWKRTHLHMCSWRWARVFIKRLYVVTFFKLLPSIISSDISCWLILLFPLSRILRLQLPFSARHFCNWVIVQGQDLAGERETIKQRLVSRFCNLPSYEGDSSSPLKLWLLHGPIAAGCGWHDRLLWAQVQENGEYRENRIFLYSCCLFGVSFFIFLSQNLKVSPGVLAICTLLPAASALSSGQGIPEGKKWSTPHWIVDISNPGLLLSACFYLLLRVLT